MSEVLTTQDQTEERGVGLPQVRPDAGPDASNRALCDAFRHLLTHGFYVTHLNGKLAPHNGHSHKLVLTETKAWRGDVWKAFAELERRLCPTNRDGGPRTTPTHPTPIKQDTPA